jgi:hypothetical protein
MASRRGLPQSSRDLIKSCFAAGLTRVRAEQFVELVEQGAERVPGGDDLAVSLRDYRLPPAVPGPDDDRGVVLSVPLQAKYLVIFVRYQPQPARPLLHFTPPGLAACAQR